MPIGLTEAIDVVLGIALSTSKIPSDIAFLFVPQIKQLNWPLEGLHSTDFAWATAAGPATAVIVLKSDAE